MFYPRTWKLSSIMYTIGLWIILLPCCVFCKNHSLPLSQQIVNISVYVVGKSLGWMWIIWGNSGPGNKAWQAFPFSSSYSWGTLEQSTQVFLWIDWVVTGYPTKSPKKWKCTWVNLLFPLQLFWEATKLNRYFSLLIQPQEYQYHFVLFCLGSVLTFAHLQLNTYCKWFQSA